MYTSKQLNSNFKVKVYGFVDGSRINTLVGFSGLFSLIGDYSLTCRLLDRAFASMGDFCICRLRRGIKITFYRS